MNSLKNSPGRWHELMMRAAKEEVAFSPKLGMWYVEAHKEIGIHVRDIDRRFAIFPKRFFKTIEAFDHTKIYDFCFIGAFLIDKETAANRAWIIDFINKHFSETSYLQFTDRNTKLTHRPMGRFDYTFKRDGFVPTEVAVSRRNFFDQNYYRIMCQTKFALCPAGDQNWSIRFYEALMCKAIPIILDDKALRTSQEADLDYKYFTPNDSFAYANEWVKHNYNIFLKHHTLQPLR